MAGKTLECRGNFHSKQWPIPPKSLPSAKSPDSATDVNSTEEGVGGRVGTVGGIGGRVGTAGEKKKVVK